MMKSRITVSALAALGVLLLVAILAYVILAVELGLGTYQPGDTTREGTVSLPDLQSSAVAITGPPTAPASTLGATPTASANSPSAHEPAGAISPTPGGATGLSPTPSGTTGLSPTPGGTTEFPPTPTRTSTPSAGSTPTSPSDPQPGLPLRAAFYYPWFPQAWTQSGIFPYTNFAPSLGFYDSGDQNVIRQHVAAMQYGNLQAGIASWWGQDHHTDRRMPTILSATAGTSFHWSVYYEPEGQGDPGLSQITADLTYLRDRYGTDPHYLRIDGRFVVFVYADASDRCSMADRWEQANTVNAYVVLKVFSGYRSCASQPDGWHQYGPAVAADAQGTFSYSISPGFWKVGESPRLSRDLERWNRNIRDMIASGADFQLITTFNEWGEGTSVESAREWESASGYGAYLDALHNNGGAHPTATRTAPPPATTPAPTRTPPPGAVLFSAAGDHGATSRTDSTLSRMSELGLQFHLALGDLSYDDRTPESAWCDYIKSALGASFPFQLVVGNHEEDSRVDGFIRNFAACLPDRMGAVGDYATEYYFDVSDLLRVILIAADLKVDGVSYEYVPGNPHYQWLADTIDDARARGIPWVVVGMHKVCVSMGNKPCEVGDDLMDLLIDQKRVDLILMAHDHDYQRSKQLTCSDVASYSAACVADDGADGQYTKGTGTVIVIAGMFGGGGFTSVDTGDPEAGYFAAWMGGNGTCRPACTAVDRGIVRYIVTATSLSAELFTNSGDFRDSFTIR